MSDGAFRRRVAPAVLVAGLGLSAVLVFRATPQETDISFSFRGDRSDIEDFSCELRAEGAPSSEPDLAWRWSFDKQPGPVIHRVVQVAPANYVLEMRVNVRGKPAILHEEHVALRGGEKRIVVDVENP